MADAEVVEVEVDAASMEATIEATLEALRLIKSLAADIGAAIKKAFEPLQKSLQKAEISIYSMTEALKTATIAIQKMMEEFSLEQFKADLLGTSDSLEFLNEMMGQF